MHLRIITQPAEVVSTELAKSYLRIDFTEEDALISSMVSAAVNHAEKFTRRSIAKKTYELIVDGFHPNLKIPNPPLISVDKVTLIQNGSEILPSYTVKEREPAILMTDYADCEEMRVQYQAGYEQIPKDIEQAILLLTSHFYENREIAIVGTSIVKMPFSVESLLYPHKVGWF